MPGLIEGVDPLDSLESQIEELEKRIIGSCDLAGDDPRIVDSLVQSSSTINNAVSSHGAIKTLFDRLDQLGTFLDPSFEDSLIDLACKKKVVLESEEELRHYLNQSKKLSELNNTLSGEPFKKVPTLSENLRKVTIDSLKLQTDFEQLKKDIEVISSNYTDAIKTITESFLLFDTQLVDIEEKCLVKTKVDEPLE